jgi:hypothetical protein
MINTGKATSAFQMFQRADQILIENNEDKFPLHALDFSWEGFEPSLTCYDSRDQEVSELDLRDINFSVGRKRTCIGRFLDDGSYVPCPKNAKVEKFAQCQECSEKSFLPFQECVFEPKCEGEECNLEFCKREHVLYVAFYDTRMKLGMSSTRRVERRLIEQGADAFAILGKAPNRKKARELEKNVSARLGIPQAIKQDLLLRNFARKVDETGIQARYEGLKVTMADAYQLSSEPLHWIRDYPIHLPLAAVPQLEDSWGKHKGRFIGIKGKWAVYESDGLKALNLSYLPARFLSRD